MKDGDPISFYIRDMILQLQFTRILLCLFKKLVLHTEWEFPTFPRHACGTIVHIHFMGYLFFSNYQAEPLMGFFPPKFQTHLNHFPGILSISSESVGMVTYLVTQLTQGGTEPLLQSGFGL